MDRKLNTLFSFLLVVVFITAADIQQQWHIILAVILATGFSFLAFLTKKLTLDGMFAAIVVGIYGLGLGGWPIAVLIVLFFVSSALLSSETNPQTVGIGNNSRRNGKQVWANGLWFIVALTLAVVFNAAIFVLAAVGALATATADTWGTEIGTKKSRTTYLITTFNKVSVGTDGGISLTGTAAALLGSLLISGVSVYVFSLQLKIFICIFAAGFLGSVADSYFGATFQRNKQSVTVPILQQNFPISNNLVNGISTGIGAVLAIILKLIVT